MHYVIINVLHLIRRGNYRKQIIASTLAGFAVFFLISGAWIYLISNKYGHFTFSTMRDTNFNAPGPDEMGGGLEFGVPVFYEGFFEPPNETAFVIWEDPSYLRGNAWSPFKSIILFKHFIKLFLKNISQCLKILSSFSFFSLAIIIAFILILVQKTFKEMLSNRQLIYPLFTIALYSVGYLLFHLEERYLWLVNILILLMGGHLIHYFSDKDFFKRKLARNTLIVFFVLSFIFEPVRYIARAESGNIDVEMYLLSRELKEFNIHGNIASNREVGSHDAWHKTFRLAYWLNSRYYGQEGQHFTDEKLENELKKYDIDYYLLWGEQKYIPLFLNQKKEVTNGNIPNLRIYSLKEEKQ